MRNIFSKLFIFTGILCFLILGYLVWERYYPKNLSFSPISLQSVPVSYRRTPVLISIPAIHVQLPIIPSQVKNRQWETTTDGISYLNISPQPGEKGNSIFYGHNFPNLLGGLPKVKPGDEISITFDDNTIKNFLIKYTSIVSPAQVDILKPSHDKRITIYTCIGWFDMKRFVAVGILE